MACLDAEGEVSVRQLSNQRTQFTFRIGQYASISALMVSNDGSLLAWNETRDGTNRSVMRTTLMAMNEHQLGNQSRAHTFFAEAKRIVEEDCPPPTDRLREWWMWRLQILRDSLLQQAETLMEGND